MVKIEETEGNGGIREATNPRRYYNAKSSCPPSYPSLPSSSTTNYPQSRRSQYQSPPLPAHPPSPPPPLDSPSSSTYESLNGDPSPQHDPNLFPYSSPTPPPLPPPPSQTSQSRAVFNLLIRNESLPVVTKTETYPVTGFCDEGGSSSSRGRGIRGTMQQQQQGEIRRRSVHGVGGGGKENCARKFGFGLRVIELVLCLISFCVMVSDKNRGWAVDSFDRYKEFRYSMYMNAIGFAYSVLQMITLLITKNGRNKTQLLYYFDFMLDQMLAYLLVSASSSAATRVDDWILNWGMDEFPMMATVSIGMSFMGFLTFALSSLTSGYLLYCCAHP